MIKDLVFFCKSWLIRDSFIVKWVNDLPDEVRAKVVYVEGNKKAPDLVAFCCPCGCRSTIQLSLLECSASSWNMSTDFLGRVTLSPSVWRTKGCKSHFFLKKGKIEWCFS